MTLYDKIWFTHFVIAFGCMLTYGLDLDDLMPEKVEGWFGLATITLVVTALLNTVCWLIYCTWS